jgi:hypothetical protein
MPAPLVSLIPAAPVIPYMVWHEIIVRRLGEIKCKRKEELQNNSWGGARW